MTIGIPQFILIIGTIIEFVFVCCGPIGPTSRANRIIGSILSMISLYILLITGGFFK